MASGDGADVHADGHRAAGAQPQDAYPGQRLGMPEHGRGSVAHLGRRAAALVIDWVLCELIASRFGFRFGTPDGALIPLAVFAAENLLLVGSWGSTVGHRLLGMRVIRMDGRPAGPVPGLIRTVLLCVVIPAIIWDRDSRGLHDKAAGTVLIRL